jgi:hypothetical protein
VLASAYCIPLIPVDAGDLLLLILSFSVFFQGDLVLVDLDLERFLLMDLVVENGLVVLQELELEVVQVLELDDFCLPFFDLLVIVVSLF